MSGAFVDQPNDSPPIKRMIEVTTLTDGGQQPHEIAGRLADFLSKARSTLDIAVYDFALSETVREPIVRAMTAAHQRGVAVRILYNVDHRKDVPVPPPPRTDR